MKHVPLPNIPGETIKSYRARINQDVAQCRCGCAFEIAEYVKLLREVLKAGNANTRATKELMRQAGTGWARRAREALARAGR